MKHEVSFDTAGRTGGVIGAGSLISQHLIGIAAGVGVIPVGCLLYAEIGKKTLTWQHYRDTYGLPCA